jgi:gamma-glutamylcyclotransferase
MISVLTQRALKFTSMVAVKQRKRILGKKLPPPGIFYFAYGANLSPQRFEKYHMNVEPVGVAKLEKYALKFTLPCEYREKGYASVEREPSREVWGFLYKIDRLSLHLLDVMEWAVMNQYRRVLLTVKTTEGKEVQAHTYQARYPREGLFPSDEYKKLIQESARQHGFPIAYIEEIQKVPSRDKFDLDPGFSFLVPNKRRYFEKLLRKPYLWHDKVREIVCEKLRF